MGALDEAASICSGSHISTPSGAPRVKTSEHHVWLYDPLLLLLSSEHLLWLPHFYAEWAPGDAPIRLRLALGKLLLSRASDSG